MNIGYVSFYSAEETRSALLELCLKGVNLSSNLDTKSISDKLNGFTGSDITNVCRLVLAEICIQFNYIYE